MAQHDFTLRFAEAWQEPGDVTVLACERDPRIEQSPNHFIRVQLPRAPDGDPEGGLRSLSLASAPEEPRILLATAARPDGPNPFETALESLHEGDKLRVVASRGRFELVDDPSAVHVVIALGIGATVARSLAAHAAHREGLGRVHVLQAPIRDGFPFEDDFRRFAKSGRVGCTRFHAIPSDVEHLAQAAGADLREAYFYIAGPAGEVGDLKRKLVDAGVNADRIRAEPYTG